MSKNTYSVTQYMNVTAPRETRYRNRWIDIKSIIENCFGEGYWHIEQLNKTEVTGYMYDVVRLEQLDDAARFFGEDA